MSVVRACFIGIDRYNDQSVRDLTGAVRDAKALHALFSDSVPSLNAALLINEQASQKAIRQALKDTLSLAGPDDTVIFSFAGHGSPSHRLLASDTSKADFSLTTISMDELAEMFRESAAKYILCLLDCCFSGGAGARVFDEAPLLRDPADPYAGFNGKGRVLFAASRTDQPALEDPVSRHGLFTKALLDVLEAQEDGSDLTSVSSLVMDRVRADARRLGFEQTPVVCNLTEGGMKLPRLRQGKLFRDTFPDAYGIRVGDDIGELTAFGLPSSLVTAWKERYPTLNELQGKAVNDHRLLDGESLVVVAPTSSGKTFIGEMAAGRAVVEGRKAVFLLPYRALVSEKFDQFEEIYGQKLGMRVIRCSGDYSDDVHRFVYGKYDLAVLTYEMFLSLIVGNRSALSQIGIVVLDEAQFVTDPTRGIAVELLLTLVVAARERGIRPQVVALSAVIGNLNHFDAWLACKALVTFDRPVKLVEGVIDRSGTYQYLDDAGQPQVTQLIAPHEVRQRRDKPSAQDVIVPLVRQLVGKGQKIIVFRNQKGAAQGCAKYLSADLGLPSAAVALSQLPKSDPSTASVALRDSLQGGTAFHTANLNRDERAIVERAFRDLDGGVHVLAATTTVAAGINTPASTVIIAEQEFKGESGRPFTVAEYKNMAGRAGRLGLQEEGMAIIYAESPFQRTQLFQRYVQGQIEPMASSFSDQDTETWVLRLLAQVPELARKEVPTLLASTYGGYLQNRRQPDWAGTLHTRLDEMLNEMLAYGLVDQEREIISLTPLGRACGNSSLSYRSGLRLIEMLRAIPAETVTAERLMALAQALPESDLIYTPLSNSRAEQSFIGQASIKFGDGVARYLQRFVKDASAHARRCKRACLLDDWIKGTALDEIEGRYSLTPFATVGHGEIRGFADTTRFHLRSAMQILRVIYLQSGPSDEELETLLMRLEVGLPADAVGLLPLPVPLQRGEYLALYKAGATDADAVKNWQPDVLIQILGADRAARLAEAWT